MDVMTQHELQHDIENIKVLCNDTYDKWSKDPYKSYIIDSWQSFDKMMEMWNSLRRLMDYQIILLKNDNISTAKSIEPKDHKVIQTNNENSPKVTTNEYKDASSFPCSYCIKTFSRKYHLKRHEKNCRFTQPGKYKCNLCSNNYQRKSCLDRHWKMEHYDNITF